MPDPAFLTTREVAELLRIKERKVYDLAASGDVPVSRAMGKLLFPRKAIEAWVAQGQSRRETTGSDRPTVYVGSHDPLVDWALRASGSGIAALADGSFDGLERFARGEAILAGLHVYDGETGTWNVPAVTERFGFDPVVLIGFARRSRGLIVPAGNPAGIGGIADLAGSRVALRPAAAGSRRLFERLAGDADLGDRIARVGTCLTETEAALAVLTGEADVAFGLRSAAERAGLGFVPLLEEAFDLLVWRKAWFDPPFQRFLAFCRTEAFRAEADRQAGADLSEFGQVRFNGP